MTEVSLGANLWFDWATIAVDHARQARCDRKRGQGAHDAGDLKAAGDHWGHDEFRNCMVATTSAAFALRGLDGRVHPLVDPVVAQGWVDSGKSEHALVRLALLDCYFCQGTLPARMDVDFPWLFNTLRNPGVHHALKQRAPVPAPAGPGSVVAERDWYKVENAERAVGFMLDMIELVGTAKLARREAVRDLAGSIGGLSEQLRSASAAPTPSG